MSQTRGVRKATPPAQKQSAPQQSGANSPSTTQTSGSSAATGSAKPSPSGRGVRDGTLPTPTPLPSTTLPPIKTVDEINENDLQGTTMQDGALTVQLKSDSEGVTETQRNAHMEKIQKLSQQYLTGSGTQYPGIETKLVTLLPAYIGRFHPDVIKAIKDSKEVKRVSENQLAETMALEPVPSWGVSRVTLSDEAFDKLASPSNKTGWLRDTDKMGNLGKGVTICIVDSEGFYNNDFEEERIIYSEGAVESKLKVGTVGSKLPRGENPEISTNLSHATMVANTACGTRYGMAPRASAWVYSPRERGLTGNDVMVAFEKVARLKTTGQAPGHVILNLSWGFPGRPKDQNMMEDSLQGLIKLNIIPVVAAGNSKYFVDDKFTGWPQNAKGVIVVGNSGKQNFLYKGSNYGPKVDVYAPGVDIPFKSFTSVDTLNTGTSFSAPLVAGFLANLLSSEQPGKQFTVEEIRKLLRTNYARKTTTYTNPNTGRKENVLTITAIMQPSASAPVAGPVVDPAVVEPPLVQFPMDKSILSVSLTPNGYDILVPLDSTAHFTDQRGLDSLIGGIASKNPNTYAMVVRNGLSSAVNPQDSWAALKQLKIEHSGAATDEKRAKAILTALSQLVLRDNPPMTKTILSCSLKAVS